MFRKSPISRQQLDNTSGVPMHYYILLAYIGVGLCVLYVVEYGDTSEW